jgi:hypothetical protein
MLGSAAFIKITSMKIDDSIMLKSGLLHTKKQRCGHQIVIGLTPLIMLEPSLAHRRKRLKYLGLYEVQQVQHHDVLVYDLIRLGKAH